MVVLVYIHAYITDMWAHMAVFFGATSRQKKFLKIIHWLKKYRSCHHDAHHSSICVYVRTMRFWYDMIYVFWYSVNERK